ncbi:Hematopoietic prostaglandin D synthase [Holothuria leucospilota]|uniref:Hematopoietic prostaglandin D synthase n=1 Tax=Holothuria leucospilota TaxID=206669 RepID=A0A9Q1CF29_HOLLE|nr:Hematopoietic prostaglandin D synthase [Holothuria leucospilota]
MPSYKLIYFDIKARAEVVRYMMELKGIKYEDHRIQKDTWPELKPKTPLGQLPVLEIDGAEYPQSNALFRYIAREYDLYGSSPIEQLQIDVVCETVDDMWPGFYKIFEAEGDEKKNELRKKLADEGAMKLTKNLEKLFKNNKDDSGWFVGNKITLVDVMAFNMIYDLLPTVLNMKEGEVDVKEHDVLKAFVERFTALEKIADWIKRRPQTTF